MIGFKNRVFRCWIIAVAWLVAVAVISCGGAVEPAVGAMGSSLEEQVLFGGSRCVDDSVCVGGFCAGGACIGFLMIPSDMGRDIAGVRLRDVVSSDPAAASRVAEAASRVLADDTAETFSRARAADLFRFLPCEVTLARLAPADAWRMDAVKFYAARARTLCGDRVAAGVLEGYLSHGSEPVRKMASDAIVAGQANSGR
ncbi:MAG TPA: hypothetical protein PKG98_05190 [Myxococcota bacterium]|nr:hypothetical protein [Myxococcota bacterium]